MIAVAEKNNNTSNDLDQKIYSKIYLLSLLINEFC